MGPDPRRARVLSFLRPAFLSFLRPTSCSRPSLARGCWARCFGALARRGSSPQIKSPSRVPLGGAVRPSEESGEELSRPTQPVSAPTGGRPPIAPDRRHVSVSTRSIIAPTGPTARLSCLQSRSPRASWRWRAPASPARLPLPALPSRCAAASLGAPPLPRGANPPPGAPMSPAPPPARCPAPPPAPGSLRSSGLCAPGRPNWVPFASRGMAAAAPLARARAFRLGDIGGERSRAAAMMERTSALVGRPSGPTGPKAGCEVRWWGSSRGRQVPVALCMANFPHKLRRSPA